jgi:membrane fusion protein, multidrug efflux system
MAAVADPNDRADGWHNQQPYGSCRRHGECQAWRIIANYKQSYLLGLRVGDTAWVWLDWRPWQLYRARIAGIGRGISRDPGPAGLLPYVAPTIDWILLQRRFPVTIMLVDPPPDLTLFMGANARTIVFP